MSTRTTMRRPRSPGATTPPQRSESPSSLPTTRSTSASLRARWAAASRMPAPSAAGWDSSRIPLPLTVVSTGTPYSANAQHLLGGTTRSAAGDQQRPACAVERGRDLLDAGPAGPDRLRAVRVTGSGRRVHGPSSTSTGTSRCTGRGREVANRSKTSARTSGISSADSTRMLRPHTASRAACWFLTSCSQPTSAPTLPARRARRDRQDRHRVGVRRGQGGDRVGDARAGGRDEHARTAADPRIAVGGVPGALLVPGDDVPDARTRAGSGRARGCGCPGSRTRRGRRGRPGRR